MKISKLVKKTLEENNEIEILKSFSFFETDEAYKSLVLESFKNAKYEGVKLVVEESNKKKQGGERNDFRGRDNNRGRDDNRGRGDKKETNFKKSKFKRPRN